MHISAQFRCRILHRKVVKSNFNSIKVIFRSILWLNYILKLNLNEDKSRLELVNEDNNFKESRFLPGC